jgi:membrane protein YqaA with SNARE-associated domain
LAEAASTALSKPRIARWHLLRRLYNWTLSLAERKHSTIWLAGLAFAESSFFPVPPDVLLIPLVMGGRRKAMRFATVCTAASVIGGLFGYLIGLTFMDVVGNWLIEHYGVRSQFELVKTMLNDNAFWFMFTAGLTPIPYKVFTIAAGVTQTNLAIFVVASILGRGARFYTVSILLYYFGEPIKRWIDKYFNLACVLFTVALIGGFFAIKYLWH